MTFSPSRKRPEQRRTRHSGCGAIRYETETSPVFENHCQCTHCQKRIGTGHGSYLTFGDRAWVRIAGTASKWSLAGDSGAEKTHAFCATCGTPVFLTFAAMPNLVAVHAASLDDPGLFRPKVVTYAASAPAWDIAGPGLPRFERSPG